MDCSNKKLKNTLIASSVFLVPLIINKLVFFMAERKYPLNESFKTYDWRLGKVAYSVKGSGKPLVFIHGAKAGSSSAVWTKNVKSLAENYRVYTIDLLGYGASERVNTTYTAYTYASLINDFITDIVGKGAAVIAEGEGAMFALSAYKKNPKNFKKLILICPKGINERFAVNEDKKFRILYSLPIIGESFYLINVSMCAVRNTLKNMISNKEKTKILTEKFYSAAHFGGGLNRFVYASYKANYMNTDIKPYISEIKIPCMFIWGEQAEDYDNFEEIQGLTNRAEYVVFEDTASLPNYENADEFNKIAKEFLK